MVYVWFFDLKFKDFLYLVIINKGCLLLRNLIKDNLVNEIVIFCLDYMKSIFLNVMFNLCKNKCRLLSISFNNFDKIFDLYGGVWVYVVIFWFLGVNWKF